jgi:Ulp1 family protease
MGSNEKVCPSNMEDVHKFANHFKQHIYGITSGNSHYEPLSMESALVPQQGNGYDCGPFSLLNLRHAVSLVDEFISFRPSQHVLFDWRSWYRAVPEGVQYRERLLEQYQQMLNQRSSRESSNNLNQQEASKVPVNKSAHIIDSDEEENDELLYGTSIDFDQILLNKEIWGNFSLTEGIDIHILKNNQWLESHLVDLFGVILCQQLENIGYVRTDAYAFYARSALAQLTQPDLSDYDGMFPNEVYPEYLKSKTIWLVPINVNNWHWQLLVLINPGTDYCLSLLMDSNNGATWSSPDNFGLVDSFATMIVKNVFGENAPPPRMHPTIVPKQPNGYDCGTFSLLNMAHIIQDYNAMEELRPGTDEIFDFHCWYHPSNDGVGYRNTLLQQYRQLLQENGIKD